MSCGAGRREAQRVTAIASPKERPLEEYITFTVRGQSLSEQVTKRALTEEVSPILMAMVEPPLDGADHLRRAEVDAMGRYVLEGPASKEAFALLVECVRQGGMMQSSEMSRRAAELDLESRIEACRYVDYYLLPGRSKMQLTKELFGSLVGSEGFPREVLDMDHLGLCRSEMIMEKIYLSNLQIKNLRLENSHVRKIEIRGCNLLDCDLSLTVTAGEVTIIGSRLENVQLGVFTMVATVEDCQLINCNLRLKMTKGGSSISLKRARLRTLPRIDCDGKINLSLEDCDLLESLTFQGMLLNLRSIHCFKPCEFLEVEFPSKVCEINFPKNSRFYNVRFKDGLRACVANGCRFEYCNLGYGQEAMADCLMTQCNFQSCRFPFLEDGSPVSNFAGSNFVNCRIQWSGPFAHEESFVINSHWLRKWNLAGCTVSDGQTGQ